MLEQLTIRTDSTQPVAEFLDRHGFSVDQLSEQVYKVTRDGELPVFVNMDHKSLYFEVDLGNVSEYASQELYFQLLDLNTLILPVSLGIDTTAEHDPRLVLVESREFSNLDENELLSVFNALELATDKVEALLSQYVK